MNKVLWLPAWYPNKIEPLSGDFIQRHAKAVSIFHPVQVICVIRDKEGRITRNTKEENYHSGELTEKIIYYHTPVFPFAFIDKYISYRRYHMLYRRAVRNYIESDGLPICSHVHIANRNGLVAIWLKKKYGIPYVVSEQWTAYLPEARPNFQTLPWYFKFLWQRIMNATEGLSVVSRYLGNSITKIHKGLPFVVIPNVVDSSIFISAEKKVEQTVEFIHISTLGYQKNPEGILKAFAIVKKVNPGFKLSVFGPISRELTRLSVSLGLENNVNFYNEVPQSQLATFMQQADALILYSRYETFGCVIIEANSCGLPAIVSDIPVFHEIIEEGINGYFVPPDNPEALAEKIQWFMKNYKTISPELISSTAKEKYNYHRVGKLFSDFYQSAIFK